MTSNYFTASQDSTLGGRVLEETKIRLTQPILAEAWAELGKKINYLK